MAHSLVASGSAPTVSCATPLTAGWPDSPPGKGQAARAGVKCLRRRSFLLSSAAVGHAGAISRAPRMAPACQHALGPAGAIEPSALPRFPQLPRMPLTGDGCWGCPSVLIVGCRQVSRPQTVTFCRAVCHDILHFSERVLVFRL